MGNAERREKCPQGHSMDPNWGYCPYCRAEEDAKQKTRSQNVGTASSRKGTTVGNVPPAKGGGRETKVMGSDAGSRSGYSGGGHVGEGKTRRITGIVITYKWRGEGELYPIREGRNYIGRGKIASDPHHRDCDIMVPADGRMSETHALILCRHGTYEVIDQEASNGTFLNGKMLKANLSYDLENYAEIRTGKTIWTFIKIEDERVSQTSVEPEPPVDTPPPEPDPVR